MKPIKQVGKYTLEFYDKDDDMVIREISELNFVDSLAYCKKMIAENNNLESFTIDMPRYNSKYNAWSKN